MEAKISYYEKSDLISISKAKTLEELVEIGLKVLYRMPRPVYWIAGPITSGPRTEKQNRKRLRNTITYFKMREVTTLNYLPLQKQAVKILEKEWDGRIVSKREEYRLQEKLRDSLYAPIFRSGKIDGLCVMPDSEMSLNVHWIRGFAHGRGISVKRIPEKLVPK